MMTSTKPQRRRASNQRPPLANGTTEWKLIDYTAHEEWQQQKLDQDVSTDE